MRRWRERVRETHDKLGERPSGSVSKRCAWVFAGFKFNSQGGLRIDHSDNSFAGRRLPSPAAFLFPNEAGRPKANYSLFIVDGGDKMLLRRSSFPPPTQVIFYGMSFSQKWMVACERVTTKIVAII